MVVRVKWVLRCECWQQLESSLVPESFPSLLFTLISVCALKPEVYCHPLIAFVLHGR
jgi:hypothetical protein